MIKQTMKSLDEKILRGALYRYLHTHREAKFQSQLYEQLRARMDIHYITNTNNCLAQLCDQYGSDKGEVGCDNRPYPWPAHSYTDLYDFLFPPIRNNVQIVIECGIGTNNPNLLSSMGERGRPGASLRVWRDYFPNAQVIGLDIDENTLFTDERIITFQCDQTSAESIQRFRTEAALEPSSVDLIIDDGLHEISAGITFFENMVDLLAVNGTYIIEDITPNDAPRYSKYLKRWGNSFSIWLVDIRKPGLPIGYNTVAVMRKMGSSNFGCE